MRAPVDIATSLRCAVCGPVGSRAGSLRCACGRVRFRPAGTRSLWASDIVHLVDEGGETGDVVLKLPKPGTRRPGEAAPIGEAAVIARLAEALGDGRLRVPELLPLGADGAIAMRRIDAPSLEQQLLSRAAWLRPRAVARSFEAAGAWLAAVASATSVDARPFDPAEILARTEAFATEARDAGWEGGRAALATVRRAAEEAAGVPVARCLVHNDFRPSHALGDERGLTVIDFEQSAEGWAHEDAAYFLAGTVTVGAHHPVARLAPAFGRAEGSFAAAYARAAPPGWKETRRFFEAAAFVRTVSIELRGDVAARAPALFRRLVLPSYDRRLRRLASAP